MISGRIVTLSVLSLFIGIIPAQAQDFSYNLYLNVGFVNISAGKARLNDTDVVYDGRDAVRTQLAMKTNSVADRVFELRDTMVSYNTPDGEGIFYSKTVNEGKKHVLETARFTKDSGHFIVNLTAGSSRSTEWRDERIFDMLSMLRFTRDIDMTDKEPGYTETLPMVNGDMVVQQYIIYQGMEKIKADDGKKYDCLKISVRDYKYGEERETLKAYVTADGHVPVQLNIIVGVASIKALLTD